MLQYIYFLFLLLFISFPLAGEGFIAGTLVRTAIGYTPIEYLKANDVVVAYDFINHLFLEQKITAIQECEYPTYIQLIVDNYSITLAPDQQLYNPVTQQWVQACYITPSDLLLCNGSSYFSIQAVEHIKQKRMFYAITVNGQHNFCITPLHIHVHNVVHIALWAAAPVVSSLFSLSTATVVAPPLAATILAGIASFFISKKRKQTGYSCAPQLHTGTGGGISPPQDPDKNKKIIKVNNMQEFFDTSFGKELKPYLEKTKQIKQGQSVYRVTRNMPKYNLRKGDLLYLDNLHKDHLEVFTDEGFIRNVLNLDGNPNVSKMAKAKGRRI